MFIAEDNIFWHFGGPSDHTGSHKNWFQGCKIDLITHPKRNNGCSFCLTFVIFISINANEIIFI